MIDAQPEGVPGRSPELHVATGEVCARCATRRIGSFRFCFYCHHDYDQPMLEAPSGATTAVDTSAAGLCPSCHTRRVGNFRFCLFCRRDFDEGMSRGLSAASLGMADALAARQPGSDLADRPWGPTRSAAGTATAEASVDLLALAPAQITAEPLPVPTERQVQPLETPAEGLTRTRAEPVTRVRAGRRIPRRLPLIAAVTAIAFLGVSGAIAIVSRLGAAGGQPSDRPAVGLASPGAVPNSALVPNSTSIPDPTPMPTYSAAIRPGPITFGTKLSGLTVADPTTRIKIGPRVIWVARMSQPSIETAVEMSLTVLVSGKQIVVHRESTPIGLNGLLTANPGVNSRDLGPGKFVVRYTSQGTILAEGSFTVVK